MLRKIRIVVAALSFMAITGLFLDFTGTLHGWLGWMTRIQFLPAVLALNVGVVVGLLVLTLLFGRIYCSVICPLGVMQDLISWVGGIHKKNRFSYSPAHTWLRYSMLALFVVALVGGIGSLVVVLEPYSAYGRIASDLLTPLYLWGNNLLAAIAEHYESYAFYRVDVWLKSVAALLTAVGTLALLGVLAWRNGRTYCNTICPVGTVLGVLSRYSLFKIRIDVAKCNGCKLCTRNCKSACIHIEQSEIDYSRCVACMNCIGTCHQGALSYSLRRSAKPKVSRAEIVPDSSRRQFLGLAGILAYTAVRAQEMKVDGGLALIERKRVPDRATPITPAGSWSARHMAQHCTGCQLCVSVCPNQVLRPSGGLMTLMQPELSYERGYCRPECTRCSEVCPTGAIQPITRADKSATQIGHAVWIQANCLAANEGVACTACVRHCPAGAIKLVRLDPRNPKSPRIPAVNEARCIGCGACENLCPARPFSAIYVEGHLRHRTV